MHLRVRTCGLGTKKRCLKLAIALFILFLFTSYRSFLLSFFLFSLFYRYLPPTEAAKHAQTLFKSLYRSAAKLLETKRWEDVEATCGAMIASSTADNAPLALSAAAKLASHLPDPHDISLLANIILNPRAVEASTSNSNSSSSSDDKAIEILSAVLSPANSLRKRLSTALNGITDSTLMCSAVGGEEIALKYAAALELGARIVSIGQKTINEAEKADDNVFASYAHSAAVSVVCASRLRAAVAMLRLQHTENSRSSTSKKDGVAGVDWKENKKAAESVFGWKWPHLPDMGNSGALLLSSQELTWVSSSLFNLGLQMLQPEVEVVGEEEEEEQHHAVVVSTAKSAHEVLQTSLTAAITALYLGYKTHCHHQQGNSADSQGDSEEDSLATACHHVAKRATAFFDAMEKAERPLQEIIATGVDTIATALTACPSFLSTAALTTLISAVLKYHILLCRNTTTSPSSSSSSGSSSRGRRGVPKSSSSSSCCCLTASLQQHASLHLSEEVIARVARTEVAVWANELSSCGGGGGGDLLLLSEAALEAATSAAQHLLTAVYPATSAPLDHVRTLLLLHKFKFEFKCGDATTTAAAAVVKKKKVTKTSTVSS